MENHTAKHFALQLGSLASLYLSLSFLLVLIFGLVNLAFPDAINSVWETESSANNIRLGIAMVLVFFPTYITLTRIVNKNRRLSNDNSYLGLTKWLIYLSLLVGGGVLLGDLVAVIMSFLEGEITQRFILKALAVLIVVGAAFYYYLKDAKGYWIKNEKKSIYFALGMTIVVLSSVVIGFLQIPTPGEVREQKLDQTQINDLQNIQWRLNDYLVTSKDATLPDSLDTLYSAGQVQPTAPENRPAYRYEVTDTGFKLCATFATASNSDEYNNYYPSYEINMKTPYVVNQDNWNHGIGDVCFERVVKKATE